MIPPNTDLERELRMAARVMTLDERKLRSGTTLKANGKDTLKKDDYLGRSPDLLDAAALACYTGFQTQAEIPSVTGVVG
jgi:predicted hotdog family 3-hydroxylacyl-ACP dehydratase